MGLIKKLTIIFILPVSLFAWKMESGTITLPSTIGGGVGWTTVTLKQIYTDPVVFAMPTEENGYPSSAPAALRIKDVNGSEFKIVQLAGTASTDTDSQHPEMNVSYFVIEKGQHTYNGIRIEAGEVNTSKVQHGTGVSGAEGYERITFNSTFSATPIVLAMIQDVANQPDLEPDVPSSPWLTTAMDNVNQTRFDIALERAEVNRGTVTVEEQVGYLAMDAGIQNTLFDIETCQSVDFETILTPNQSIIGWDDRCSTFNYTNIYSSNPNVIGAQNDHRGGDGGWLRMCSQSTTSIGLVIDEDIFRDNRAHGAAERAGLLIFANDFVYDSTKAFSCDLITEYRLDECFWLGSAYDDVRTNTPNTLDELDGSAFNGTQADKTDARINHAANFDGTDDYIAVDSSLLNFSDGLTVSFWVYPTREDTVETYISKFGLLDGGWYVGFNGAEDAIDFVINLGFFQPNTIARVNKPTDWINNWHHISATFDGQDISLTIDGGTPVTATFTDTFPNSANPMYMGARVPFFSFAEFFEGNIDELKIFDVALSETEIDQIRTNEASGTNLNYDGTTREPVVCSASTGEKDWQLIGIPAEARAAYETITFDDVFSSVGTAGVDYFAYRPVYEPLENTTTYAAVTGTENIEFGTAYWLTTAVATTWDVEGLVNVDYDISKDDVDACTDNRCVEIDIVPAVSDGDDSSGPNNYTMFGFVGKSPVDWADCRIVIDGTDIYTPEEADSLGYISREIWSWPSGLGTGSDGNVRGSDYHSCTDVSVAGCQLIPFQGYWIQTKPDSIGHTVQILLPKGDDQ